MKLACKVLVAALLVAALAVPTASAKPGGSHGKGKPAWAGGGKGAEKSKAAHEKKAKKENRGKKHGGQAASESDEGKNASGRCKDAEAGFTEVFASLFGSAPNARGKCAASEARGEELLDNALAGQEEADAEQTQEQELELPSLEGLGPGQYCHALEAWMSANGGDFSTTYGTEGSGYANDHGKCASRRAHGEDLLAAALQSVCDAAEASGTELPEACQETEQQAAPSGGEPTATGDLAAVLRLLSFF